MIQTILVIGATGMLGEPAARQLLANGFRVRVLSRSIEKAQSRFGAGFEVVTGEVEDTETLKPALQGCQGVHINLNGMSDPDLERRGTVNILKAIAAVGGVERVSYLSGASVCEENCWYAGTRAKFLAEAAIRESGVPYTIFRSHYFMETLRNMVRGSMVLQIGRHPRPYDWVAARDYAHMVGRAYTSPTAANKTLYVCGPQALTMREALTIYAQTLYPQARFVYVPLFAASLVARLGQRKELQAAIPFFSYCEKAKVLLSGSPAEANALLGAPMTTLKMWTEEQIGIKSLAW